MNELLLIILMVFWVSDLWLAAAGRLLHCIRIVALQGFLLAVFSLTVNWNGEFPHGALLFAAGSNIVLKGILLPLLLGRVMRKCAIRRELEPRIGFGRSLLLMLTLSVFCFWLCRDWEPAGFAAATAFTTMLTGLFLIVARTKAITQVVGFLVFENGITLFGAGLMVEIGFIVELGILLDVLVLVFVMGIAVFQIKREFAHIDTDQLTALGDAPQTRRTSTATVRK